MKILQINVVYAKGSTGNIVMQLHHQYMVEGYESVVIYGRGNKPIETNVFKCCTELESNIHHFFANRNENLYGGMYFATRKIIKRIKKEKPDIVHLHCLNGYFVNIYKLLTWLKVNNIKTVITNHAEFYYTGNCGYSFSCDKWQNECKSCEFIKIFNGKHSKDRTHKNYLLMRKAFNNFNNCVITSVSPWVDSRTSISPILKDIKHEVVLNGINTDYFIYHDMKEIRKELNLPLDKKIFIFICSNWNEDSKKEYFLDITNRCKDYLFLLVGAPSFSYPNNVINLGYINNPKLLSKYYSASNYLLSLSKRETFSLPVAESLCSGTPVVGFLSGGPETIAIIDYSSFVKYGDIDLIVNLMNEEKEYNRKEISDIARDKYSINNMKESYLKVYEELINGNK